MNFPSNLNALVEQLNSELNKLESELDQAIELIRERITLFPENVILIQLFATLSNYTLFTENTKRRITDIIQYITTNKNLSEQDIQEAGEVVIRTIRTNIRS